MKPKSQVAKRIAAACVVAAGIGVLWAVGITWLQMIKRTILPSQGGNSEGIRTALDGTTVINTYASGGNGQLLVGSRTLDGKPWPLEYDEWLQLAYMPPPFEPPGIVELPLPWDEGYGRTAGTTDGKLMPTAWYLVLDNDRMGTVYAAGFDDVSKKLVGYIGRSGFSAAKPSVAEQFFTPRSESGFEYLTIGPYLEHRRLVDNRQLFRSDSYQWTIYLLGTDRLWEIDLRQRTAKPHAKFDGATSIGQMSVNRATFDRVATLNAKERAEFGMGQEENAKEKTEEQKEAEERAKKSHYAGMLAVREADRMILFDLQGTKRVAFKLPEQIRKRQFSALLSKPDQLLIVLHEVYGEHWSGGPIHRLYWISPQGHIDRELELKLAGWVPPTPQDKAWMLGAFMPEPIVALIGIVLGVPLWLMQINFMPDFASAVAYAANAAWAPLIAVLLVAAVFTGVTVKLQQKYRRSATVAWSTFVFLLGVPGFLAYLVEHRRSKLEACTQCGEIVPRDRDACAACNNQFAPPARVGTEIFA